MKDIQETIVYNCVIEKAADPDHSVNIYNPYKFSFGSNHNLYYTKNDASQDR